MIEIKIHTKPALRSPKLVGGLPGSGYVGKLAADHLIKELGAHLAAEIYSYSFPPQVILKEDGTIELMKNELHFWENPGEGPDLLIMTGNAQAVNPEGQYELAEKILELSKEFGADCVYMMAAYITGRYVDHPKVFGAATTTEGVAELEENNVTIMREGSVVGMNGLLFALAKLRGIKGYCLLGETSGYIVDAKAAQAVLEVLAKRLNIKVNMTDLENRAKETEKTIRRLEELERKAVEQAAKRGVTRERELPYIS
jgi:uncharacterized protein (TIGR00162 family)